MNSLTISLICFVCIFCGSLVGLFLRTVLPAHHLSETTWDSIKIGTGLIATLTALVLGLLVNSAKSNFDTINAEITQAGARIILLDRVLARYGPEAKQARDEMRRCVISVVGLALHEQAGAQSGIKVIEQRVGIDAVQDMLHRLTPQTEYQRSILAQATNIVAELTESRWLTLQQLHGRLPKPFLIIMVLWLTVFFICFGLLSESNATVITVMLVCAMSVTGAIFLILEMNNPLHGIIRISIDPLRYALEHLGK